MTEDPTYPVVHCAAVDTHKYPNKSHSSRQSLIQRMPFHIVHNPQDQEPNRHNPNECYDHESCVDSTREIIISFDSVLHSPRCISSDSAWELPLSHSLGQVHCER